MNILPLQWGQSHRWAALGLETFWTWTMARSSIYYVTNCVHKGRWRTSCVHHSSFPQKEGSVVSCRFLRGRGSGKRAGLCREGVSQHPGSWNAHDSRCKTTQDDSKYQREADGPSTNTCICQTQQNGYSWGFHSAQRSIHVQTWCCALSKR